ncbi:MAG: hypothetical protein IJW21_02590, partial [Clostridia bacterium]|nr:hypothetical protein [Clostridia bacterium]
MKKFLDILKKFVFLKLWQLILLALAAGAAMALTVPRFGSEHPVTVAAYALSAYALAAWCFRIPYVVRAVKKFKRENKYVAKYSGDAELRVRVSLYGTVMYNLAYAALQMGMAIWHGTAWFFSLGVYYILLAVMRFFLIRDIRANMVGRNIKKELVRYRFCGVVLVFMNAALGGIVLFMTRFDRGFEHNPITTIAMAASTFTSFTMAIVNMVRYRKFKSPVLSAAKVISLASASVSMLTLTSAMLNAFGEEEDPLFEQIMTNAVGTAVCIFVLVMAFYMIISSTSRLKK